MNSYSPQTTSRRPWPQSLPFYYGWVNVVLASLSMTATLPGRTHGLGLITKPLLEDLSLEQSTYAHLNLTTSLLGAAFCLPIGWLIDRRGVRSVLTGVVALLALAVWSMSLAQGRMSLFFGLLFVRGLGQSALSIVSMAIIGKWFSRRLGMAMGVFSVLLTFGFIATVLGTGETVRVLGWRPAWQLIALGLTLFVPLGWLLVRNTPEECGLSADEPALEPSIDGAVASHQWSLLEALRTPAFWVVVLGTSAFNFVWSAITLFNELVLNEQGFDQEASVQVMGVLTGIGLLSNLIVGKLANRDRIIWLLGVGLAPLAVALGCLPAIRSMAGLLTYGAAMGLSGGAVTVVFFAAWGHLFGRQHLGRIQGAAQLISVLASALGPELMAASQERLGSYAPAFYALAAIVGGLSILAFFVAPPQHKVSRSEAPTEASLVPAMQPAHE